jgi:Raf kinase inhibitor-like YbhB/YbcL family protein
MAFELTSTAIQEGQPIPRRFSGEGEDVSPPLKWPDPPEGTKSFVLVCEDPDAPRGTFTHWVVFNLPGQSWELSEGMPREEVLPNGTTQGVNDFGKIGYNGPKPPPGKPHRYFFRLFALDRLLDLPAGINKDQVLQAIQGHVLAEAPLMGTYEHGQVHELPTDPFEKKAQQDRGSIYTAPLS